MPPPLEVHVIVPVGVLEPVAIVTVAVQVTGWLGLSRNPGVQPTVVIVVARKVKVALVEPEDAEL